ncbi:hypothetical protein CW304_24160 [Bacillus sp. UFRGS-B20]|nr:hypothetical protein CW304_24160 [Bacillus sp. UFRGS-B20]
MCEYILSWKETLLSLLQILGNSTHTETHRFVALFLLATREALLSSLSTSPSSCQIACRRK